MTPEDIKRKWEAIDTITKQERRLDTTEETDRETIRESIREQVRIINEGVKA